MEYRNLAQALERQADRLGPRPALRFQLHDRHHDLSWEEYRADVRVCAAPLIDGGFKGGDRVDLLSENRVKWLMADMAFLAAGDFRIVSISTA